MNIEMKLEQLKHTITQLEDNDQIYIEKLTDALIQSPLCAPPKGKKIIIIKKRINPKK